MVSKITDKILPQVKEWHSEAYRVIPPSGPSILLCLWTVSITIREEGRILTKAAYVVLGVTTEGYKEILSIAIGANETSKFWLRLLNGK